MIIGNMRKNYLRSSATDVFCVVTSARWGGVLLCVCLLLGYGVLPFFVVLFGDVDQSYIALSCMALVAIFAIGFGVVNPVFDTLLLREKRLTVSPNVFNPIIWGVFVVFVFVAWATADKIPLLAALAGATPDVVAVLREQFLKARNGWQSSFVYINAILSGALIPYSLAIMFLYKARMRWLAACFFLFFCISFMEKAFFFKAVFPLLYLVSQGRIETRISPRVMFVFVFLLLFFVAFLSGSGSSEDVVGGYFFSLSYVPQGELDHLLWRSIAVPMLTAADAIRVFDEQFNGRFFLGATSSFFSAVLGMEHIEFERIVFAAQWGQNATGTGSANSVFITEAFVNFGWFGVFVFSYFVGFVMRLFVISRDEAFRSLWPLFAIAVYTSGLIGVMLSNGFLILLLIAFFVKISFVKISVNN